MRQAYSQDAAEPSFEQLRYAVCAAVDDLYDRDRALLGATERAIVGRMMIYLDRWLGGLSDDSYFVLDQEYEWCHKITPDLIYHRRGDGSGNLLAIEVRTGNGRDRRLTDFAKLSVLTGHADQVLVYPKRLRLVDGDGDLRGRGIIPRGRVGLPAGMAPCRYGLWLLAQPDGPEYWWWRDGRPAVRLPGLREEVPTLSLVRRR